MQIRLAHIDDAEGLARVHVDSWRVAYKGIVPDEHLASLSYEKRAGRWRESLSNADSASFVYVAQDADGNPWAIGRGAGADGNVPQES